MLKRIVAILGFLAVPLAAAADIDASLWAKSSQGTMGITPWLWYAPGGSTGPTLDLRYNFDTRNGVGMFLGWTFGDENLSVAPFMGIIDGADQGGSLQVYVSGKRGKFGFFTMHQYASMSRDIAGHGVHEYRFLYHWGDFSWRVNKRLAVSIGEQVYHESGHDMFVDIGPAVKVFTGRGFYARAWTTVDPGHNWKRKTFVGIGLAR